MLISETQKLKLSLIAWIEQLSDMNMLSVLEGLKGIQFEDDWTGSLSEIQKRHISEGLDDIENGRTISPVEFWDKLKNG